MHSHLARFWTRALLGLALLLGFAALPAAARPKSILDDEQFRSELRQGLDRLYDMDYDGANAAFAEIETRYPDHPVGPFLRSLHPWWEILVDPDDDAHDDAFFDSMSEVIKRCDRRLRRDPQDLHGMFFQARALAFPGRLFTHPQSRLRAGPGGPQAPPPPGGGREQGP